MLPLVWEATFVFTAVQGPTHSVSAGGTHTISTVFGTL